MTLQEHKDIVNQILENHGEQAKVSELLAQLTDDYTAVSTTLADNTATTEKAIAECEELRKANMTLFRQIGLKPEQNDTGNSSTKPEEDVKYEDLFDESGNLK